MKLVTDKLNFIGIILFVILLFLSSSRMIMHNNFPVVDHSHENFTSHFYNLKKNNLIKKKNLESSELCKKIDSKIINRHYLRWVFEELRVKSIDLVGKNFRSAQGTSIAFTLMISFLIISTFTISILTAEKNLFYLIKKNQKNFVFLLFLFYFILAFYSFRLVSELRFSFFEMFFISISLYASYRKNYLLFLLSVIMATLNRESGIVVSSIWFIINGFIIRDKKFFLVKKEILIGLAFIVFSVLTLILFNYKLFNCNLNLNFLYHDNHSLTVITNKVHILNNFNIIFSNHIIIIFLLWYFYIDFNKQIKLILIILFYNIIFLLFTPSDHMILRIMFAPIFVLYAYEYIIHNKEKNYD